MSESNLLLDPSSVPYVRAALSSCASGISISLVSLIVFHNLAGQHLSRGDEFSCLSYSCLFSSVHCLYYQHIMLIDIENLSSECNAELKGEIVNAMVVVGRKLGKDVRNKGGCTRAYLK